MAPVVRLSRGQLEQIMLDMAAMEKERKACTPSWSRPRCASEIFCRFARDACSPRRGERAYLVKLRELGGEG